MAIEFFERKKQEWLDMDAKFRYLLIGVASVGTVFILYQRAIHQNPAPATSAATFAQPVATQSASPSGLLPAPATFGGNVSGVLPNSPGQHDGQREGRDPSPECRSSAGSQRCDERGWQWVGERSTRSGQL
jgi:hypothetical protein